MINPQYCSNCAHFSINRMKDMNEGIWKIRWFFCKLKMAAFYPLERKQPIVDLEKKISNSYMRCGAWENP
jgi:hypothetical protein